MALSKLAPGITSITGKFGGVVFKRDASGQHIVSMQRQLHKPSTPAQKPQRAWYGEHKREEREDPGPRDPILPPKTRTSARVFSLFSATTYRDATIIEPDHAPLPDDPAVWAQAQTLAEEYLPLIWEQIGTTLEFVTWLFYRFYWLCNLTWGMNPSDCWTLSTTLTIEFLNRAVTNNIKLDTLHWIEALKHALTYTVGGASSNHWGHLIFWKWNLLLRTKTHIFWSGLVARPSPQMYTIYKVPYPPSTGLNPDPELPFEKFQIWHDTTWGFYRAISLKPGCIFQFLTYSSLHTYTWTFKNVALIYLGDAYRVAGDEYRMKADEITINFLEVPVGWSQSPGESHMYLYNLHSLFEPD
jgi:hypothetical protein